MQAQVMSVSLASLRQNPNNPRGPVGPADLGDLVESLRVNGQSTPIKIRKRQPEELGQEPEKPYEIIGGHRRVAAAKALGWQEMQALLLNVEPGQALREAIVDNSSQAEANWYYLYKAIYCYSQANPGLSQRDLAAKINRSQALVNNALQLMTKFGGFIEQLFDQGLIKGDFKNLPVTAVLELFGLNDASKSEACLNLIVKMGLGQPKAKALVAWVNQGHEPAGFLEATQAKSLQGGLESLFGPHASLLPQDGRLKLSPAGKGQWRLSWNLQAHEVALAVFAGLDSLHSAQSLVQGQDAPNPFHQAMQDAFNQAHQAYQAKAKTKEKALQAQEAKAAAAAAKQALGQNLIAGMQGPFGSFGVELAQELVAGNKARLPLLKQMLAGHVELLGFVEKLAPSQAKMRGPKAKGRGQQVPDQAQEVYGLRPEDGIHESASGEKAERVEGKMEGCGDGQEIIDKSGLAVPSPAGPAGPAPAADLMQGLQELAQMAQGLGAKAPNQGMANLLSWVSGAISKQPFDSQESLRQAQSWPKNQAYPAPPMPAPAHAQELAAQVPPPELIQKVREAVKAKVGYDIENLPHDLAHVLIKDAEQAGNYEVRKVFRHLLGNVF